MFHEDLNGCRPTALEESFLLPQSGRARWARHVFIFLWNTRNFNFHRMPSATRNDGHGRHGQMSQARDDDRLHTHITRLLKARPWNVTSRKAQRKARLDGLNVERKINSSETLKVEVCIYVPARASPVTFHNPGMSSSSSSRIIIMSGHPANSQINRINNNAKWRLHDQFFSLIYAGCQSQDEESLPHISHML